MLAALVSIVLTGLVIGGLARLAVPGPDPMPLWLTIAIGVAGSFVGGGIATAVVGTDGLGTILLVSVVAATLLVIAYRRFVQKRGITGPEASRRPTRGLGLGGRVTRPRSPAAEGAAERLRELDELRRAGLITQEEYDAKRAEVLAGV